VYTLIRVMKQAVEMLKLTREKLFHLFSQVEEEEEEEEEEEGSSHKQCQTRQVLSKLCSKIK